MYIYIYINLIMYMYVPDWKVCSARGISPPRILDACEVFI